MEKREKNYRIRWIGIKSSARPNVTRERNCNSPPFLDVYLDAGANSNVARWEKNNVCIIVIHITAMEHRIL